MPERIDQERADLMSRRAQDDAFCRALIREMMLGSERVTAYPASAAALSGRSLSSTVQCTTTTRSAEQ